jgi:hypothetical protein
MERRHPGPAANHPRAHVMQRAGTLGLFDSVSEQAAARAASDAEPSLSRSSCRQPPEENVVNKPSPSWNVLAVTHSGSNIASSHNATSSVRVDVDRASLDRERNPPCAYLLTSRRRHWIRATASTSGGAATRWVGSGLSRADVGCQAMRTFVPCATVGSPHHRSPQRLPVFWEPRAVAMRHARCTRRVHA